MDGYRISKMGEGGLCSSVKVGVLAHFVGISQC